MTQSHGHEGLHNIGEGNDESWKYQVRISLTSEFAAAVKNRQQHPVRSLVMDSVRRYFLLDLLKGEKPEKRLLDTLDRHGVKLKNQFDAFSDFCKEAEAKGETDTKLYKWTKDTIEKPVKQVAYATRFTVYDGEAQIYDEELADAVIADLEPFVEEGLIAKINKIDSNPANNPQAPAKYNM